MRKSAREAVMQSEPPNNQVLGYEYVIFIGAILIGGLWVLNLVIDVVGYFHK